MSNIDAKFKKAVYLIRHGPATQSSNTVKLRFYSLFKQALEGDVTGSQPWAVQIEARLKWDAWNELKGMSKEEAMQEYIDLVEDQDNNWESHPALADYKAEE